ncbi:hypothetical protein ACIU1J_07950 [Azospirillum doebereinerae]
MAEPMRHYALTLSIGALLIAVPIAFFGWLAGLRLARGPRRALSDLAVALEGLGDNAAARPLPEPSRSPGGLLGGSLGLPAGAFAEAVRKRLTILDGAEREVARLDELA